MKKNAKITVCKPASKKHRSAMGWFASLTQIAEQRKIVTGKSRAGLHSSIEFYRAYIQTDDRRFLNICEDFLSDSLKAA